MKAMMSLVLLRLAVSDKDISEIKERLKELKKEIEADMEFWEEFFPGLIEKEEK